jgi:signal transduction histidine kinase
MGTANRLADKAEAALDDIRRGLRRNEDSLLTQQTVKQALPELERLRSEMNRYLRPASLLVQDDAPISVRFEEASIGELMARALDELKDHFSESFMDYYRIHPALIVSTIQAELVRTSVVCDRFAVQRALTSMLDNAVKYSNPRFYPTGNTNYERSMSLGRTTSRGERCVVEIGARLVERLQMLEFYVTNWGSAPPTRDTSILFRAFERGGISDSRRSVPGLGIGLVVVGNCAEMHLGHAQIHSRPTLSDPLRQNEGSETTVVLRISLGLRPGDFVWTSGASLVPLKREGADLGDRG